MHEKMMKNYWKRKVTESIEISVYNRTQVIVETAKMTLKVNWKQIEFETW